MKSSKGRQRMLKKKKELSNLVSLTRRASSSPTLETHLMYRALLLLMIRPWQAPRTFPHLISQKRPSELSLSILSTRLIKPQGARSLYNSKPKTGLKAAPHISTTTQLTISLSKSSNQFGLNTRTENFRRNEEMKRQSKFWISGLKLAQELRLKFCERRSMLTLLRTLKKRVVLCVQTGRAKTSTQTTTPQNRILLQTRVSSKRESVPSEEITLTQCQTNGKSRSLQWRHWETNRISLVLLSLKINWLIWLRVLTTPQVDLQ